MCSQAELAAVAEGDPGREAGGASHESVLIRAR
jgi:hypothetical protein